MLKAVAGRVLKSLDAVRRAAYPAPTDDAILLMRYSNALGVVVHDTPVEQALKEANPSVKIIVASNGLGADAARFSPFVDFVIRTPDPFKDAAGAMRALRRKLKDAGVHPTAVVTTQGNQRTVLALLASAVTPARRYGFTQFADAYASALSCNIRESHIENNLRIAAQFGAHAKQMEPGIYFDVMSLEKAHEFLQQSNEDARPTVAMVVETSRGQKTNWHPERFHAVTEAVMQRGFRPVFLGTQQNVESIEDLRRELPEGSVSLAGKTDVPTLAAVLALCDACITLDTGTMHVARSVDLPLVVLGPCWQKPVEWMPLTKQNARILRGQDCEQVPENYLLDEIEVADVLSAFDDLMAQYPPNAKEKERRVERRLSSVFPVVL
ncbi:MAG: glycosyltransferase family 9 protein [Acidobacteria bacterium]|nr:glycosyltransferase family 9 protein [Acidobacteriota bacterium]